MPIFDNQQEADAYVEALKQPGWDSGLDDWPRVEQLVAELDEDIHWGGPKTPEEAWEWMVHPPDRDTHFHGPTFAEVKAKLAELKSLTIDEGWWPSSHPEKDWIWIKTPLKEWVAKQNGYGKELLPEAPSPKGPSMDFGF